MNNENNINLLSIASLDKDLIQQHLCRVSFIDFIKHLSPSYETNWHHAYIAETLERFEAGEIRKLMICVPPQHGKSELSTRMFPAWLVGKNPNRKIAVISYSDTKAREFNRDIQIKIDSPEYKEIFPKTKLNRSNVVTDSKSNYRRNSEIFDIVGYNGFVKTVGRGGALTGTSIDIAIIDDLYKDREEAMSVATNSAIRSHWNDVVKTRFHNSSQVLALNTRWDVNDWNSYVLKNENDWTLISIPGIKENDLDPNDPREIGEALWESKHSKERLLDYKKTSPYTFSSLIQQDPKPDKNTLIFGNWQVVDSIPDDGGAEIYGLDYGYSQDPTTLIKITIQGKRLFFREQFYEKGLVNREILKRCFLSNVGRKPIYCDSAEKKSTEDLRRGFDSIAGVNAIDTIKGPGSIIAGINKLNEFECYIHSSSTNLIKERNSYQWVIVGGEATNTPVDRDNHAIDAIRGAVFTYFGKPKPSRGITTNYD